MQCSLSYSNYKYESMQNSSADREDKLKPKSSLRIALSSLSMSGGHVAVKAVTGTLGNACLNFKIESRYGVLWGDNQLNIDVEPGDPPEIMS